MTREGIASKPSPGSWQARDNGCTCPIQANNFGRWAPIEPNIWLIEDGCCVHSGGR